MILLDTNVLIEMLEKRSNIGEELHSAIVESGDSVGTTSINLHEVMYGLRKFGRPLKELLQFPTIEYSKDNALLSSEIEYEMEKRGETVRRTDSMIAAIAIKESMPLLTLDARHFERIAKVFPLTLFRVTK